ncbi:MAG: efflux transporter periplasmic adaptor subunit [Rhodanobacter denitrificans]|uniref:Efflux transporter periplasmic adaptor subunit n=1 Tax=Rhodanobacter denitrificans TaxID=666685 RepID=A0A2W5K2A9_9GAMM|nr:MAG: efflux transporter periplasmic adaptor subunit [Rhodanobacter denitrificans]
MKSLLSMLIWTAVLLLAGCGRAGGPADEHGHAHGEAGHDDHGEGAEGTHGGRVLEAQDYAVELAIAEDGAPPRLRAWLYRDGKPLPPAAGRVEVTLTRLGGAVERHVLSAQADGSLGGSDVVAEPHSFDVLVEATIENAPLRFAYASYEGRTRIEPAIAEEAGIRVAAVGPGVIADEHEMQGLLTPVEGRTATVMARFPGPIRRLDAQVGDRVRAGQRLATIESNLSLTDYAVTTPIAGTVLSREATVGGVASEGMALFEIADLSTIWVDLHVFGADAQHLRPGVPVTVTRMSDGVAAHTVLDRILPGTATASQSTVARASLDNADGLWRPGSAVRARITVEQQPADRVVPLSALQTFRDWDVVFVRVGDTYEVRPVELGKRDDRQVEIRGGVAAGDVVVVEQSYLIKADIEKSGAAHEH